MDLHKKISLLEIWFRILKLSSEIRKTTFTYVFFIFLNKVCAISVSYFVSLAITENQSRPIKLSVFFLLFKLFEWIFFVLQDKFFVKTRSVIIHRMGIDLFSRVMNLSSNVVKGMSSIDLLKKTDIRNTIRNFIGFSINHFLSLMIDVVVSILILISIGWQNFYIFYILSITIVCILLWGRFVAKNGVGNLHSNPFEEIQKNENNLIASTKDLFSKIYLAKAYGSEKLFIDIRKDLSEKERIALTNMRHKAPKFYAVMFAINSISFCIVFWLSINKLNYGLIYKGAFAAIMTAVSALYWKLQQITYLFEEFNKYPFEISFPLNVLALDNQLNESISEENLKNQRNSLIIKNLSFSYGKKKILKNVSIHLENNDTLFIVGKSGAGK